MEEIPLFKVFMSEDAKELVNKTLGSGFVGQSSQVEEFEKALISYFNIETLNTLNSCTSAIHLALHMIRHLPGTEIITTPLTCLATNMPIHSNGYRAKFIDVDPNTCNIDIELVPKNVDEDTKAVMIMHWGGYPINYTRLAEIMYEVEREHGRHIPVIEDCAHAFGSEYNNKLVGTFGNTSCFSFQAIKLLSTADGGLLISPNKPHYERAKLLRWYCLDRNSKGKDFRCSQDAKEVGFKFHMNDVNASMGIGNLPYVNQLLLSNRNNAKIYDEELLKVKGVTLLENSTDRQSSYWLYTIKAANRDDLMEKLKAAGIQSSRVHERNDKHTCMQDWTRLGRSHVKMDKYSWVESLPNLDKLVDEMICIPVGHWLTEDNIWHIIRTIQSGW